MTVLGALTLGLTLGLAVGATVAGLVFRRWADEHDYRQVRIEDAKVPRTADPNLRLASLEYHEHRVQLRVDARTRELREAVGDLLDTVNTLETRLADQRDPCPVYGARRKVAS